MYIISLITLTWPDLHKNTSNKRTLIPPPQNKYAQCSLPVNTKPFSCQSVFWLRFLFWSFGLRLCYMFAMITLTAHLQTPVFIPNSCIMLLKLTVTDKLLRNFPSQELHSSKFVSPPIYRYQCPYSLISCKSIKIQAMECNVDGFGLRLCHKNEIVLKRLNGTPVLIIHLLMHQIMWIVMNLHAADHAVYHTCPHLYFLSHIKHLYVTQNIHLSICFSNHH